MKKMRRFSLVGVDGNCYCILGYVIDAMEQVYKATNNSLFDETHRQEFFDKATKKDYWYLVAVSQDMIDTVNSALPK